MGKTLNHRPVLGATTVLKMLTPLEVARHWDSIVPYIKRYQKYDVVSMDIDEIKDRALKGLRSIWLWWDRDAGEVSGVGVTELHFDTGICEILGMAGEDFEGLAEHMEEIEKWVLENNCTILRCYGRYGWTRMLRKHGWRPEKVVMVKDLCFKE